MSVRVALALMLGVAVVGTAACGRGADTQEGQPAEAATAADSMSLTGVGFETPESVLHDPAADIYLVSNINGNPTDKDDNGFISRVAPDGSVQQLKWIDGATAEVTLNGPKGLAIMGDTLFVSDIDTVRAFHRVTGAPLGARGVPGATFLNDLTTADGILYVSDSGLKPDFSASGTDAIYRFDGVRPVPLVKDTTLGHPNGLAIGPEGITFVTFGAKNVGRVPATGGNATTIATLPAGQLDGLVRLSDGTLLVSSWETGTVYHVDAQGQAHPVVENVPSPADIGFDAQRNRILIPLFNPKSVEVRPTR